MEIYLYIFLLIGSPIFGLKALIIGGGVSQFSSHSNRFRLVRDMVILGLSVVGGPLIFSFWFGLDPLYLSVLIFVSTFSIGRVFSFIDRASVSRLEISEEEKMTDEEIESMLEDRGLDSLLKNRNENDNSSSE